MHQPEYLDGLWGIMAGAIASFLAALLFFAALDVVFGGTASAKNPPCPEEVKNAD